MRINAGAYGGEIFDVLESARLLSRSGEAPDGAGRRDPARIPLDQPHRHGRDRGRRDARAPPRSREEIEAKTRRVAEKRRGALPSEPNAGSVFKNPPGDYAGRLIEACGLKGAREGGAAISERHANVIVNLGAARAADVLALMRRMRDCVAEKFGVTLFPEVELLGMKWE